MFSVITLRCPLQSGNKYFAVYLPLFSIDGRNIQTYDVVEFERFFAVKKQRARRPSPNFSRAPWFENRLVAALLISYQQPAFFNQAKNQFLS
jgi:hypothetical protein